MDSKDVANFVLQARFDKLPSEVIVWAKLAILDVLGASIAAHDTKSAESVRRTIQLLGGKPESTLLGGGKKAPAPLAALAFSTLAGACDIDDGIMGPEGHLGHLGGMVIPAALCVAESEGSTGRELLEAVVVGYEIAIRTGSILVGKLEVMTTGPIGCYGAAAAAAKLLRLGQKEIVDTFAIAEAHNLAGIRGSDVPIFMELGGFERWGMVKEAWGWGTFTGVMAAYLAREDFTGHISIFDRPDIDQAIISDLGIEYRFLKNYYKPYSACRYTHAALDGVFELMGKHQLDANDISKVIVGSSNIAITLNVRRPPSIEQAQYSIPFLIGSAIVDGEVTPKQVNQKRLGDTAILKQADKVELEVDPDIDALFPAKFGAVVEIVTKDGQIHKARVDNPKGSPENPFTDLDLKEKFRNLASAAYSKDKVDQVIKCVEDLDRLDEVTELVNLVDY